MRRGVGRVRVGTAGVVGLALLVAGCTSPAPPGSSTPDPTQSVSPDPTTPAPEPDPAPVVQISADGDGGVELPREIAAGVTVFEVSGTGTSVVTVIEPIGDYTPEQLAEDFGPSASMDDFVAQWGRMRAGTRPLGGAWAEPAETASFAIDLAPGTYWVVDMFREAGPAGDDDTIDPGDVVELTVAEPAGSAPLPEPDATATAAADGSWDLPESIPAAGALLLENNTEEAHQLVLEPVREGQTAEQALELARQGRGVECPCRSPALLGPGAEFVWFYDLAPGEYLVFDYSTGADGAPAYNGAGAVVVELT